MKRWQTRVQTVSSHNDFTFSAVVVLSILILTVTSAVDQSLQTDTHIDLMTLTITM